MRLNLPSTFHAPFVRALEKLSILQLSWFWDVVLFPFLTTRTVLIISAAFMGRIVPFQGLDEFSKRGWWFTSRWWLDIWTRYDSGWYLAIIRHGYSVNGDLKSVQSSIAFFPLYPTIVKFFSLLIPSAQQNDKVVLLVGIVLSNLFLIAALGLLYKLVSEYLYDEWIARNTVMFLILFPTAFVFSCFYTESLFLLLSVASFYMAEKGHWGSASLAGSLLALTRPNGVIIAIPIVLIYFYNIGWQVRKVRFSILWVGLVPLVLLAWLFWLSRLTGNWLAPFVNQAAWNKQYTLDLVSFIVKRYTNPLVFYDINSMIVPIFIFFIAASFFKIKNIGYGIYSLTLLVLPLLTGSFTSVNRYAVVIFPVFVVMAVLLKAQKARQFVLMLFFAVQMVIWVMWVRMYFVI